MAAQKTTARKAGKKATKKVAKKAGKKVAKKAAKKAGKKAARATANKGGKKTSQRASPSAEAAAKPAPTKPAGAKKAAATISSLNVNMGHVFALRPRPNTSFRPGDFTTAKHQLQDEAYSTLAEAAREVAERALELTHDSGSRVGTRYDRY